MIGLGHALSHSLAPQGLVTQPFVGALDEYTTGLVHAFSSDNRLLTAHEGGCFRVREDTGNTQSVIGFDGDGKFDATAFNAFIGGGNGFGVRWINQTGGNDFIQTDDATKQGQILNVAETGWVLRCDEPNDGYPSIGNISRPFTIYVVARGFSLNGRIVGSTDTNSLIHLTRTDGANAYISGGVGNYPMPLNESHVGVLTAASGVGASYYLDGANKTSSLGNTNSWGSGFAIGSYTYFSETAGSDICEILVYNVAHDNAQRSAIEAVLMSLRGITP